MEAVRRRMRLCGFDYSLPGAYFVTICARERLFGQVVDGEMQRNRMGRVVAECWGAIPAHFPDVALDAFMVMPDHMHGIILFREARAGHARPLPTVVGSFQSEVSRRAGFAVWQRSYWERIIRNERELNQFRHYEEDNPAHATQ